MLGVWGQTARRNGAQARIIRKPKKFRTRISPKVQHMVLIYFALVALQVAFFIYYYQVSWWLILTAIPFGVLLGFGLSGFNRLANKLSEVLHKSMGKALAGFLLFFTYLIGYILIFSMLVSWPLGWLLEYFSGSPGIARDFALYSINFIMLFSILSWLLGLQRNALPRNR